MPKFLCKRKCYVVDRLYKVGDFYEGEAAPTRSFEGYVEKKAVGVSGKPGESNQNKAPDRGK